MTDLAAGSSEKASAIGEGVFQRTHILTPEQRKDLSKALFPDTHTDEVEVCGQKRTLKPLTIKYARQISSALEAFQGAVARSEEEAKPVELELLPLITGTCAILADNYAWEDVQEKLREEDVSLSELQLLLVQQVRLQDTNDFLLNGLRVLVGVMQIAEIETISLQNIYNGLL